MRMEELMKASGQAKAARAEERTNWYYADRLKRAVEGETQESEVQRKKAKLEAQGEE